MFIIFIIKEYWLEVVVDVVRREKVIGGVIWKEERKCCFFGKFKRI